MINNLQNHSIRYAFEVGLDNSIGDTVCHVASVANGETNKKKWLTFITAAFSPEITMTWQHRASVGEPY